MTVELMCEKTFSEVDGEIIDCFVDFQNALIDKDLDKLDSILLDTFELANMFGEIQSKDDFISKVRQEILDVSKSDIMDPTILWDDENTASLIADVRLTAKIHGNERRWISKTVVSFQKVDGCWNISGWDN